MPNKMHTHTQTRTVANAHTPRRKTIDATFLPHTQGHQVYRNRWFYTQDPLYLRNTLCFASLFPSHFFFSIPHTTRPDLHLVFCRKTFSPVLTLRERTFSSVGYGKMIRPISSFTVATPRGAEHFSPLEGAAPLLGHYESLGHYHHYLQPQIAVVWSTAAGYLSLFPHFPFAAGLASPRRSTWGSGSTLFFPNYYLSLTTLTGIRNTNPFFNTTLNSFSYFSLRVLRFSFPYTAGKRQSHFLLL